MMSEEKMKEWIETFTKQIDEIDKFYCDQFQQYKNEFIDLQWKFM